MKQKMMLVAMQLILACSFAYGQVVIHPWHVVDNGGGKSTAGGILLQPSIGQPAVQVMTATGTNLESGYIPGLRYFSGSSSTTDLAQEAGWNMISVPLIVSDFRKAILYPGASSSAFTYQGVYVTRETLKTTVGFWIKFPGPGTTHFTGTSLVRDTLPVNDKWNMIGCLSYPIRILDITPLDSTTLTSNYWGYASGTGYFTEDTLRPGKSYWIKVHNSGKLVMQAGSVTIEPTVASLTRKKTAKQPDGLAAQDGVNSLLIRDADGKERSLYFASRVSNIDVKKWEMPPVPSDEIMDARFATSQMLEIADLHQSKDVAIQITGAAYPLTISWNVKDNTVGTKLIIGSKDIVMNATGETQIQNPKSKIQIGFSPSSGKELPKEYALHQNFPNPFNPTTTIRYDLPQQSHVRIIIYDALGREVRAIAGEVQEAGFQSRDWNSTNNSGKAIASGMYFYRIEATSVAGQAKSFMEVRKLLLIK